MCINEINQLITREKECIEYLTKELAMQIQEDCIEKAMQHYVDIGKSLKFIEQLERQKTLYRMAVKFNGKVVKRCV